MDDFEKGVQYERARQRERQLKSFGSPLPQKAQCSEERMVMDNLCQRHLARIQVYNNRIHEMNNIIRDELIKQSANPTHTSALPLVSMKNKMDRYVANCL
jgi:hypothetical protein